MSNKLIIANIIAVLTCLLLFWIFRVLDARNQEGYAVIETYETMHKKPDTGDNELNVLLETLNTEDVNFSSGSFNLSEEGKFRLQELGRLLNKDQHLKYGLSIEGHTDSDGDDKSNQELSENRAKIIRDYLVLEGLLTLKRVLYIGHGESKPKVDNKTPEGRKLNRRVEFILVEYTLPFTPLEVGGNY